MTEVPFATRRTALIERLTTVLSADTRFPAGWLEGSLADGSADSFSDIDLHLCIAEDAWDAVWPQRRAIIEEIAPALVSTDIMGTFAVAFLIDGPVKLDVFYERQANVSSPRRIAVKRLWGPDDLYQQFRLGTDLGDDAIARTLQYNVLGFLQGATWPVRLLARGQLHTFLYGEILLVETGVVPLMLLERDPRTFHRNMFTRAKMLTESEHREYARLIEQITIATQNNNRPKMRDLHIEIFREMCRLSRAAFEHYKLAFPACVEEPIVAFYEREWPM